ncbi:EAL domain-containing protein [Cellulomonas sp. NPDC055163]
METTGEQQTSARETSGGTTTLLFRHVRAQGGAAAVQAVLERAGAPELAAHVDDMAHWIDYPTRIRLFQAAVEVLDDPRTMFDVGATAITRGLDHALVLLLRTLGSPREVYRQLPRAVSKFTSTSTMRIVSLHATSATVHYRLHDGYEHSRLDCDYARGLISSVPQLFDLPAAVVEHETCQSDGHPHCVYTIRWPRYRRLAVLRRRGHESVELGALRAQLEDLQLAASDLVSSDDVGAVLERITDRAASALLAPAYLLVVEGRDGDEPVVRSSGLDADQARDLADAMRRGDDLGARAVVVDVASKRRAHGKLAAVFGPGQRGLDQDRHLLEAYARHAAAALDLLTALEDSRREASRATALLALAHSLAGARDTLAAATVVVQAMPGIVGCRGAGVMLWDAATGSLRSVASHGHEPHESEVLANATIQMDNVPELAGLITRREPLVLDVSTASPVVAGLLRGVGARSAIVVPLLAGDSLMGIATASWPRSMVGTATLSEALTRLEGLSDQAATALENARLLATVHHQSQHDALTGLPNRVLFARALDDCLRATPEDRTVAVLFCDLDRFKYVNDGFGHAAGDELLRQVGARLREVVRGDGDVLGRLSGDEFAVVLPAVSGEDHAVGIAIDIIESLDKPFRIDGRELRITASIGISLHTGPDGRGDKLLASADSAMYQAKQRGRNQVAVAGGLVKRGVVPSLEAELSSAITNDQLRLFFQPVVDVSGPSESGDVVGGEALLRWAHPRLGLLAPGAFLPLAEEAGLVTDLDLWALGAACRTLASWCEESGRAMHVAVNLAGATLVDPRLLPAVRAALTANAINPDQLHLEIVESRSLVDIPGAVERLGELRQMGVKISLDDFGTGYSTLAWIQALPVDQIKIDRTFIMALPDDGASLAVVRAVLSLASDLGIGVVAEGVEELEQLAALREVGCGLVQGYLLGRPQPELDMGL